MPPKNIFLKPKYPAWSLQSVQPSQWAASGLQPPSAQLNSAGEQVDSARVRLAAAPSGQRLSLSALTVHRFGPAEHVFIQI